MYFKVRVHAGAKVEEIKQRGPDLYEISVRAPAERGLANQSVLDLLARALKIPVGRLQIVKGGHGPSKIVWVRPTG